MPDAWRAAIEQNIAYAALLTEDEKARWYDDARIFVAEKSWEGGNGFVVTDETKITIAAQACLLLVGWDGARRDDLFPNVSAIIVYESGFRAKHPHQEGWVRTEEPVGLLGEAFTSDLPIVISWQDALQGAQRADDGHNVVLHEFAHKLDTLNGSADGVPPLETQAEVDAWAFVMSEEYRLLTHDAELGHKTLLDTYGATNEAEFFAVATEAFFECATRMAEEKPQLYAVLRQFYGQDTASCFRAVHM